MNIPTTSFWKKKMLFFICVAMLSSGLLFPVQANAYGLGNAGSLTLEGLVIGLAILGVIFLVFLGLLLMSKVNELTGVEKEHLDFEPDPPTSTDIMNLTEEEINTLLRKRKLKTASKS